MSAIHFVTRRTFLTEVGRSVFAIAILGTGVVACSTTGGESSTTSGGDEPTAGTDPTTTEAETMTSTGAETTTSEAAASGVSVQRVNLGNVSAYVLVRGSEAAIVDTGNPGDTSDIEAGLNEVGLGWGHVGSVILTHRHSDHVGSLGPVMERASEAFGYAGEPDIPEINAPRPLTPVGDGDTVFGLSIISTPGHTAGSISIYDHLARVLVVGDAMNGADGGVAGANPRFSDDMGQAGESIKKLAGLEFDAVYFGHGEPVEANASQLVTELAATL